VRAKRAQLPIGSQQFEAIAARIREATEAGDAGDPRAEERLEEANRALDLLAESAAAPARPRQRLRKDEAMNEPCEGCMEGCDECELPPVDETELGEAGA